MRWSPGALLGEGLRNAAAQRGRSVLLGAVVAALLVTAGVLETAEVTRVAAAEARLIEAGRNVVVVQPRTGSGGAIDPVACARLDGLTGVRAAGPRWQVTGVRPAASPNRAVTTYVGTSGTVAAMSHQRPVEPWTMVAAPALADQLGVRDGSTVALLDGDDLVHARLDDIVELGVRQPAAGTAVVVAGTRSTPPDACLLEFAAWAPRTLLPEAADMLGGDPSTLQARLVLPPSDLLEDPAAMLASRLTQHGWAIVGVLAGVLWWYVRRSRRGETALYRSFGMRPAECVIVGWTEAAVIATTATVVAAGGVAGAAIVGAAPPAAVSLAFRQLVLGAAAVLVGVAVGGFVGTRADPAAMLKE